MSLGRGRIAASFVTDALDRLRDHSVPVGPVLAAAGLTEQVCDPVSAERYGAFWLAAAQAMQDEAFGLGARPMRPGSFTLLCHAVLHAGTLDQALRRALRFLTVVLDDPRGTLEISQGQARIRLTDRGPPRSAFAYRTYWIMVHGVACWLVGRRIPLRRVDFRCAPPEHGADYRQFFGAPVWFAQTHSLLEFDAAYLKLPVIRTERGLRDFLRKAPANILVRYRHDAGIAATVRTRLRAMAPAQWPRLEDLARLLRIPASTLRRRLRAEGETYQAIKDDIRRQLATRALLDTARGVGEIASELGFAEPSAFHRAFRKWTGRSPAAFRAEGGTLAV